MTTTLRSKIDVHLGWSWRDRIGPFTVIDDNRLLFNKDLTDGVETWQADTVWHAADQTLLAGQSTTLELAALGQSLFGESIVIPLAKVKAIALWYALTHNLPRAAQRLLQHNAPLGELVVEQ